MVNAGGAALCKRWIIGAALIVGPSADASTEVSDLGGNQYRVLFTFKAPQGTQTVSLAGTFNGWNPQAHAMDGPDGEGVFRTRLILNKGRHEYKFVLDGWTWATDPDNPHQTAGYQNAVLYLGLEGTDAPGEATPAPPPVEMAARAAHPAAVKRLIERLGTPGEADPRVALERWFAEHPMPLFTDGAVTFVYADAGASEVHVQIDGYGSRTGYEMPRLADSKPVFAVSLTRAQLPDRMAYTFEVQRGGRSETVTDPHAWSLTSRSGRPAAAAVEASNRRGRIEALRDVKPSTGDLRPRDVYVYLPPGYDAGSGRRYPVLYLHDGQNCWDDPVEPFGHGGWCVNLTADRLIHEGKVEPFIAVGVANTPERMREYGPGTEARSADQHPYMRFLKHDLKPLIDRKYRTRSDAAHTALMGSSMGGVISLQTALLCPDTFGMAACLSPAFAFSDSSEQAYVELIKAAGKAPIRLYVDSGSGGAGQDGAPATRRMAALLREAGWTDGEEFMHFEDAGADHNERAWRARLEKPLCFLFGP